MYRITTNIKNRKLINLISRGEKRFQLAKWPKIV